jgi:capsular polysaccharide biosynthesis protein
MDERENLEGEISLSDIWRTIRRRIWLIVLIVIISLLGSYLYLNQLTPLYKSTATLLVQAPSTSSREPQPYPDYTLSERWTQTYAEMIKGEPVLKAVSERIIWPKISVDELKENLTIETVRNTLLLKVNFIHESAIYAKKVVDTVSEVFMEQLSELFESNIQTSTKRLEAQLEQLDREIEDLSNQISGSNITKPEMELKKSELSSKIELRSMLYSQYQESKLYESQLLPTVKIYQEGTLPGSPDNIKKPLTYSIALVLGIFVGVLVAFILEYLDDTIKSEEDIKRLYNLKVLGVIPRFSEKSEYYYSKKYH